MKKWPLIAVFACAFALCLALVGCGGSGSGGDSSEAPAAPETAAPDTAAPDTAAPDTAAPAASGATVTAADLANVDVTIALDDYDAMEALAKDIQNMAAEGKVVEIDGYVSNFGSGMSYNIVENNAEGTGNIGSTFVIDGADESAYPSDGTHVKITGKVGPNEAGTFHVIHTIPEFVQVL